MFVIVMMTDRPDDMLGRVYGPFHTRGKATAFVRHEMPKILRKNGFNTSCSAEDISPSVPLLTAVSSTNESFTACTFFVRPLLDPDSFY